jgi:hypothetical protein
MNSVLCRPRDEHRLWDLSGSSGVSKSSISSTAKVPRGGPGNLRRGTVASGSPFSVTNDHVVVRHHQAVSQVRRTSPARTVVTAQTREGGGKRDKNIDIRGRVSREKKVLARLSWNFDPYCERGQQATDEEELRAPPYLCCKDGKSNDGSGSQNAARPNNLALSPSTPGFST